MAGKGGRTSTTRPKGSGVPAKGAGWGGPASNAPRPEFAPGNAGPPAGIAKGEGRQALAKAALIEAAPAAARTVIEIALNPDDPRALQAAQAVLNRVGLHEKSGVEHSGPNGGPLRLTWGDGTT